MPAEPPTLSPGPLVYFLIHSGTFIVIVGLLFFVLGLAFGWLTWSRHRRMAKRLAGEIEGNKDEIAQLKRKLAEVVSRQPADDWDDPEAGTPAFPSFRGSEDLVLGAFLAKASELLPDSPSQEETSLPLDISPEKTAPTQQTLALETVPPISELDSQEEPTPAPVISAPAPTSTPHILKTLIGGTAPAETIQNTVAPVNPAPVVDPKPAPRAEPIQETVSPANPAPVVEPMPAPAADHPSPPIPLPAPESVPVATVPAETVRLFSDPHLGLVYKTKPQAMDDLSQLKGVASGIQHRLNELGVYTFKQIALWSDENILEFSRLLSFKDRIHREQWVEQARELHYHAYNERV